MIRYKNILTKENDFTSIDDVMEYAQNMMITEPVVLGLIHDHYHMCIVTMNKYRVEVSIHYGMQSTWINKFSIDREGIPFDQLINDVLTIISKRLIIDNGEFKPITDVFTTSELAHLEAQIVTNAQRFLMSDR